MSVEDLDTLSVFADDESFNSEKIEFFYHQGMSCPVGDCTVSGIFQSKAKYWRHWEEKHVKEVSKLQCAISGCSGLVRRKSDMRTHLKYVHKEHDGKRIEEIILKCKSKIVRSKGFVDPGFFTFKGRTHKSTVSSSSATSSKVSSTKVSSVIVIPTATSSSAVTSQSQSTAVVSSPCRSEISTFRATSVPPSPSLSIIQHAISYEPISDEESVEFAVHIKPTLSAPASSAKESTSDDSSVLLPSAKKISLEAYRSRPPPQPVAAKPPALPSLPSLITKTDSSSQTSRMDVKELYVPPIPDTLEEIDEHLRLLCSMMDFIGREREATKQKRDRLRQELPSIQKERELRRKCEAENRELKRQLAEIKYRETGTLKVCIYFF